MNFKSQLANFTTVCLSGYPSNLEHPFFPHIEPIHHMSDPNQLLPLAQRPGSVSGTRSSPVIPSRDLAACERLENLSGPLTSNTYPVVE